MEITPLPEPDPSHSALRLEDLSTDEEEALHGRINQYERKIDSLMTEVSSLKNEVSAREPHIALSCYNIGSVSTSETAAMEVQRI